MIDILHVRSPPIPCLLPARILRKSDPSPPLPHVTVSFGSVALPPSLLFLGSGSRLCHQRLDSGGGALFFLSLSSHPLLLVCRLSIRSRTLPPSHTTDKKGFNLCGRQCENLDFCGWSNSTERSYSVCIFTRCEEGKGGGGSGTRRQTCHACLSPLPPFPPTTLKTKGWQKERKISKQIDKCTKRETLPPKRDRRIKDRKKTKPPKKAGPSPPPR